MIIQVYGSYPKYVTPEDEMITTMLHLPPDKNKLHNEQSAQSVTENMAEYEIIRSVYDILDYTCNDTVLHPYIKQHKSKRDGRMALYAIHSCGWASINVTASEAEIALQMSSYDEETKACNSEKYVAWHVEYHIILGNLMEYGYQGLDPGSKVWYLLNGIRCDKLSMVVAAVRATPDKYEKDFDAVVAFLSQYINKRAQTSSVKVASVRQSKPAKWQKTSATHGTFNGKSELKKYSREKYDSVLTAQKPADIWAPEESQAY